MIFDWFDDDRGDDRMRMCVGGGGARGTHSTRSGSLWDSSGGHKRATIRALTAVVLGLTFLYNSF